MQEKNNHRKYDLEFRESALRLSSEMGVRPAARQLGIHPSTLRDWKRALNKTGKFNQGDEDETRVEISDAQKIRQLEKELRQLQTENEILKKATAYFAKYHIK